MVARTPHPRFHSAEVSSEFVVWSENPAGNWLQLPCFFVNELSAPGPGGLWLQAEMLQYVNAKDMLQNAGCDRPTPLTRISSPRFPN